MVGAQIDRALDTRVDDDVAPGDGRHGARDGLDVRVDEVQGDRLASPLGMGDGQRPRRERASEAKDSHSIFHVSLW